MAIQSQPSRIPEPFAGSGTKNTIPATNATPSASQAASWASGFPPECSQPISAGGCPVPRNDMNGALNQLSQDFAFRQDGGVWEWSAQADYDVSRMVRGSNGTLYWSVAQSGPSVAAGAQDPTLDAAHSYWTAIPDDDANVVHRTGNETIAGEKEFEDVVYVTSAQYNKLNKFLIGCGEENSFIHGITEDYTLGGAFPAVTQYVDLLLTDKNDGAICGVICDIQTAGNEAIKLRSWNQNGDGTYRTLQMLLATDFSFGSFAPVSADNNFFSLGQGGARWAEVFAVSGTINTSDERTKSSIAAIPDDVLDAWGEVGFVQYQFNDAVEKKGEAARLHSGLVAQRIDEAFKARGLDASRYGLFCYDSWDAEPEQLDAKGNVVKPAREAGDEYSLRYEEALCVEAAYQRRRADRAEARLAALEERLAAIEAKLG